LFQLISCLGHVQPSSVFLSCNHVSTYRV
jgi:hypothetical protein